MPTSTAARGKEKAVAVAAPTTLSPDELADLLNKTGMGPGKSSGDFRRMSLVAGSLVTDPKTPDEESWPPVKKGPTMTVRIVKPPVYYLAFFLSEDEKNQAVNAARIGRPELNGKFVKKYDDPAEQSADEWSNVEVYEDLVRLTGSRGQFKGDIQQQIMPDTGEFTGEEPIYTLSLSASSAIDFRGSRKNPAGGVVQEFNFVTQLARLAEQNAIEKGVEPAQEILDAMTALRLGGVVAEIYLINTTSQSDPSISWTVVAYKPIHYETGETLEQLSAGEEQVDDLSANSDDIPF